MRYKSGFCPSGICFDPGTIMAISMVAMAGFGAYEMSQTKSPEIPGVPAAPDPKKAAQEASDAQTKERKMLLATGGQTDYTKSKGSLLGDNINTINLSGS